MLGLVVILVQTKRCHGDEQEESEVGQHMPDELHDRASQQLSHLKQGATKAPFIKIQFDSSQSICLIVFGMIDF